MGLAEFIHHNREPILGEWEVLARSLVPRAGLSSAALRDHAPDLLTAVISDMTTPQSDQEQSDKSRGLKSAGQLGALSQFHAHLRVEHGFTLGQVVAEYRALRASVFRLWTNPGDDPVGALRFNEAIDEALVEAVEQYSAETAQRRDYLLGTVKRGAKENAELLTLLVDGVKDYAIFMLDPGGHVATWNLGAERIKGYPAVEIIGKHFSAFYPREDVEAGKCDRELEVASREGRFEDEGWRVRKDGSLFWANVVITALHDAQGRLRGFGKVTRDLTTRVQAERERLEKARAEEGARQKEEFLAIMGHELRNPLAPMMTAVHLIQLRRGMHCDRELAVLDRQMSHMTRLMDDLLDVSRLLRGDVQLATKVIEIGEVLANAVDMAAPLIEQKKHRLRLDIPTEPLLVNVDPDRMAQVFVNLLNNAAKYSDKAGEILVGAKGHADEVDVTIEDRGIGISASMLPRVFDLFSQAGVATDRHLGGFGIGLAVVKRLVTEHGGGITAESEGLGRGSRFTVRLPRSFASAARSAPPMTGPLVRPASVPRRALVVDDSEDSAEMMRELLRLLGHDVRIAFDGQRALEVTHEFKPEIVFLDIGLPSMNGFEVARRMRQIPGCAAIPIIAVSGYARETDREETRKAGFTEHLAKPVDVARLEQLLVNPIGRAASSGA